MPKILKLAFPSLEVHWNKSDFYITFPNGSEIWFFGLDDSRAERILGMEFSSIFFDEASELSYSAIQLALSRLAERNTLAKRVYFAFNPPSKVSWSYYLFVKKLNPQDDEPLENPEDYGTLLMNPIDNLENIDTEYLQILERMPKRERERFLEGKFAEGNDGVAYYEFDPEIHVQDDIVRRSGTVHLGQDYNISPQTAVIASVVNNEIHVFDEMYLDNCDTMRVANYLSKKGYMGTVYPDSTGKNRKTSGKSDHQIMRDAGFDIKYVHNPIQYDRVNNINKLLKEGRIKIHPRCKKLINDLNKVSWKDNKLDQKTDKMLTHISDALGYLAWNLMPFDGGPKVKTHTQRNY